MNGGKIDSGGHQIAPNALKIVSGGVGQGKRKDFGQLLLFETEATTHPVDYALQSLIRERKWLIEKWDRAERQGNPFAMAAYEQTIVILEGCYYHVVNEYERKSMARNNSARLKLIKSAV